MQLFAGFPAGLSCVPVPGCWAHSLAHWGLSGVGGLCSVTEVFGAATCALLCPEGTAVGVWQSSSLCELSLSCAAGSAVLWEHSGVAVWEPGCVKVPASQREVRSGRSLTPGCAVYS